MLTVTLEQRIKTVILPELGLGLDEFAKRCGVHRQTLYKAFHREKETGHHDLDAKTARKLADGAKRSRRWIVGEDAAGGVDTLSLAGEAAADLARDYSIPEEQAWLAMRGLRIAEPSRENYYREGGKRLLTPAGPHLRRNPETLDDASREAIRRSSRPAPSSGAPRRASGAKRVGAKPSRS